MKFLVQLILIAIVAYLLEFFMPWYCIALAAFGVSLAVQSKSNFLAGFFGIGLLWLLTAWIIDSNSASGLAERVAQIIPVQKKIYLMLIGALLAGLIGGFAAVAGASLRREKRKW
jgi:hypothetical protein